MSSTIEVETAIHAFTGLMEELQGSHKALELRAERMEAELQVANAELACKVDELDSLRRHLEAILLALPTGVVERTPSGRITRVNAAASRLLGLDPEALVGLKLSAGLPAAGDEGSFAYTAPDGAEKVLDLRRREVLASNGRPCARLDILEDRTELERVTEHLHTQSKMVALGTMAGGIAHEVRNPMNAIRGFAALLLRSHGSDPVVERHASRITAGVDEVDAILSSVLAFADPERLRLEDQNAADCVQEALNLVARDIGDLGPWKIECETDSQPFIGDGFQLRIALRNLVANAISVQPKGGQVRVRTATDADSLTFTVEDSGPGLDPSQVRRLRDPFFTTRAEGTGLGLALVDTIARLHGGSLDFDSAPSDLGGARFVLRVPVTLGR